MYDVAVLGGGPAGSAAAIALARLGRSVVLIERNRGPGDGFCGEFLSPDGVGSLEALGALDAALTSAPALITEWSVRGGATALTGVLPAPGFGITRRTLDPLLRRIAADRGAEVMEGAKVQRVRGSAGRFEVELLGGHEILARQIVGATGRSARIPGLNADTEIGPREFVAFKAHFRGAVPCHEVGLFPLGGAYVGICPVSNELVSVCYLARRKAYEAVGATPEAIPESGGRRNRAWADCWSALQFASDRWLSTGGLFFRPRRTRPRPGVTFCGDAAGLISPFLGEGMSMALEAGVEAGTLVHRHFDDPELLARDYARVWSGRFRGRLQWGERLQRLLLSDRAELVLRWLAVAPAVGQLVVERSRSRPLAQAGRRALQNRSLIGTGGSERVRGR